MRRILTILFLVFLTACSAQPVATPTPTTLSANTNPPASTQAAATPATLANPDLVVFKIVSDESKVQYEVGETFLNQNNRFNLAVGVTQVIDGEIYANLKNPPKSTVGIITVDISKFKSDSGQRDQYIRRNQLESEKYPNVVFTPKSIEGLPQTYVEGQDYAFKVSGDIQIRDKVLPVTFDIKARLSGDTLSGTAETNILMSQFGFGPISLAGILQTEDKVKITFTFTAKSS